MCTSAYALTIYLLIKVGSKIHISQGNSSLKEGPHNIWHSATDSTGNVTFQSWWIHDDMINTTRIAFKLAFEVAMRLMNGSGFISFTCKVTMAAHATTKTLSLLQCFLEWPCKPVLSDGCMIVSGNTAGIILSLWWVPTSRILTSKKGRKN